MNKLLIILFLSLNGIFSYQIQINPTVNTLTNNPPIEIHHEFYDLSIYIEKQNKKNNLVVVLKPKNNAFFMSPFEEKEYLGKYYMDLGDYANICFDGEIKEFPATKKEFGPQNFPIEFGKNIKWRSENTKYIQALKVNTSKDFEVFGRIRFTIEPSCTLEEIPFAIRYKNGIISLFSPNC